MPRWQGINLYALFTFVHMIQASSALPASLTQDSAQSSTYMRTSHIIVKVELNGPAAMPSFGSLPLDQVAKVLPFWNSTELSGEVEPGGSSTILHQPLGGQSVPQGGGDGAQGGSGDCSDGQMLPSAMAAITKTQTMTDIVEITTTTTTTVVVPVRTASTVPTTTSPVPHTTTPPIRTPSPYTQTFSKTRSKSSHSAESSKTITSWTQVFQSTSQTQSPKPSITPSRSTFSSRVATSTTSKSTATQQATGAGKLTQWDQGVLDQHNSFRAKYKAPPLTWDATLASTAMQWAQRCEWKHDPALGSLKQGQNMDSAASSNGKAGLTPEAVLEHWVTAEVNDYDPNNPQASHSTQVVWKGTSRVGCASVSCNLSMYDPSWWPASFVVCNYAAPGNVAGQYAANVAL